MPIPTVIVMVVLSILYGIELWDYLSLSREYYMPIPAIFLVLLSMLYGALWNQLRHEGFQKTTGRSDKIIDLQSYRKKSKP